MLHPGVVTTIDSIKAAATGVTMRSPGHGVFFQIGHQVTEVIPKRSQGQGDFSERSQPAGTEG